MILWKCNRKEGYSAKKLLNNIVKNFEPIPITLQGEENEKNGDFENHNIVVVSGE
jgi:hypothetical protein